MKIAIFSDVHGKILLPFKLVDLYQQETGSQIDLILQCGDLGAYPDLSSLDKATVKHAQYDRDELGFYDDFTTYDPSIGALLDRLDLDMICIRGNHEDHDFLDKLENETDAERFPIDVYKRVFICKTGMKQVFGSGGQTLTFAGIGRIGDRKGRSEKRFIQEYERAEIRKLMKSKTDFDLLITHDKAIENEDGYGTAEIRSLLDHVIFHWHFYGHTGEPFKQETDDNGITQSVKVKELEFNESGILPKGCMLILEKTGDPDFTLEVVGESITNQLTKFNWKY